MAKRKNSAAAAAARGTKKDKLVTSENKNRAKQRLKKDSMGIGVYIAITVAIVGVLFLLEQVGIIG